MTSPATQQKLPGVLSALAQARAHLLGSLNPVPTRDVPLAQALGLVAGENPPLPAPLPVRAIAQRDGFAMRAEDLAGASAYAPVLLHEPPVWVEAGQSLPEGCDCVIDAQGVDLEGPLAQAHQESFPGENIRRSGEDGAAGARLLAAGRKIGPLDLLVVTQAGFTHLAVRQPHVVILDVPAQTGARATQDLLAGLLVQAGARISLMHAVDRSAGAVAESLKACSADLLISLGGTGCGHEDASVQALARAGQLMVHGLALEPGRTAALGRVNQTPCIACPGAPDQALAIWFALIEPALARLAARTPEPPRLLPLSRKIASRVGLAEGVLLVVESDRFTPIAVGDWPLQSLARATHVSVIEADSEGHASGDNLPAFALRP